MTAPHPSPGADPVVAPGERRLVWRDEFRGDRLNLRKWRPNWLAGNDRAVTKPINDLEVAAYDPRSRSPRLEARLTPTGGRTDGVSGRPRVETR